MKKRRICTEENAKLLRSNIGQFFDWLDGGPLEEEKGSEESPIGGEFILAQGTKDNVRKILWASRIDGSSRIEVIEEEV